MEYGCIAEKLGHSFSKIIHNKLGNYDYELREIAPEDLKDFILKRDFKAINVTIPYKEAVIPFLDEVSDTAIQIGAVNTIVNKNGKLYGYNTDFYGLKELINQNGIRLKGKNVLILGSGGTSKTAGAVAKALGAGKVFRVSRKGGEGLITYAEAYENQKETQIIINTTPCGMFPNIGNSAVDIKAFPNLEAVVDAVYNPLSSALVVEAKKRGIKGVGGLFMLVAQGVFAAELFLDKTFKQDVTQRIFKEIEKEKQNIVLIGMPAVGKTTVGKALAQSLGKEFVDTDDEIIKKSGISIPEIFSINGEKGFRKLESQVIKEVASRQGLVIATGGGAVLNTENVDLLKENGKLFFLDRDIEEICVTADRPLSSNREDLQKRYNERYPVYCSSADFKISCTNNVTENVRIIKEVISSENFSD